MGGRTLDLNCPAHVVPSLGNSGPGSHIDSCSICLASFLSDEHVRTLRCPAAAAGHTFHRDCIDEWFFRNYDHMTCPLCNNDCSALRSSRSVARYRTSNRNVGSIALVSSPQPPTASG